MGIVFPHVDDADTAKKLVSYCLFPPKGHRSMTGSLPQLNFVPTPISEVATTINDSLIIVMMLESPEAINNVEDIAAISGVDVLLIGTNDLCMEMGLPGQLGHPDIVEAYKKPSQHAKNIISVQEWEGIYEPDLMDKYINMGIKMILGGNNLSLMISAGKDQTFKIRTNFTG